MHDDSTELFWMFSTNSCFHWYGNVLLFSAGVYNTFAKLLPKVHHYFTILYNNKLCFCRIYISFCVVFWVKCSVADPKSNNSETDPTVLLSKNLQTKKKLYFFFKFLKTWFKPFMNLKINSDPYRYTSLFENMDWFECYMNTIFTFQYTIHCYFCNIMVWFG